MSEWRQLIERSTYIFALITLTARLSAAADAIDFDKQIAPIFIKNCIGCHNAADKVGGLDLTTAVTSKLGGDSGEIALIPHHPQRSNLLTRIADGDMPPEDKGVPLNKDEVALVEQWIRSGAPWPDSRKLSPFELTTDKRAGYNWWSLEDVRHREPPKIDSPWIRTPIDAFVLEKLREHKLEPSPEADRVTLIRRLTYDLIGLPPSPEEVEAFVTDDSPDAYARVVNRLLDSPHFGERWARHWLDVAHYADTHGFERDFRRDQAWPYRDYVIRSLNNDKPYNEFIREQIAGDVIDPKGADSVIATGFLAAGPWDFVGHKENKDPKFQRLARADDLDDMVTTVMTATVGLTVNCARCHTHKFDPIPHEDYYRLWAVFSGIERGDRPVPVKDREELNKVLAELNCLEGAPVQLADIVGGGNGFGSGKRGNGIDVRFGRPTSVAAQGLADVVANRFMPAKEFAFVDGVFVPNGGPDGKTPITISSTGTVISGLAETNARAWDYITYGPSNGAVFNVADGVNYSEAPHSMIGIHANKGITFDLDEIRKATGYSKLKYRSIVAYGGAPGDYIADAHIYLDGKMKWEKRGLRNSDNALKVEFEISPESRFLTLIATDGDDDYTHDQVFFGDPLLISNSGNDKPLDVAQVARRQELKAEKIRLENLLGVHLPTQVYAAVSVRPAKINILQRGDTESPAAEVSPGALSCVTQVSSDFSAVGANEGARRLALAEWIVSPANPLTRRVLVNRLWHHHFGRGIVDTPSDFGFHGGRPSHPELLDWLANEFLKRNWSQKEIHRLIVMSSAYRQSSIFKPEAAKADSDNRFLWRIAPRRLEAEAVRDAVLSASGKLNRQMGGPGYRDFEFVERYAPIYRYITADQPDLWRRTIYRFTVRSVPNQFMEVLDCPNPSNFAPAREQTTTALQSLALLNNDFMLKQAGYLAERIEREAGNDQRAQIQLAFQLTVARTPHDEEIRDVQQFIEKHGLFHFCRVLLNTNEFLYVD